MSERDPRCIFTADNRETAEFLAAWLTRNGISADVVDNPNRPPSDSGGGVEVWALDPLEIPRGIELLEQHSTELAREVAKLNPPSGEPIRATCEDCGREAEYAFATRGTVQTCPHCAGYVDIPGDEDEPFPEDEEPSEDE